MSTDEEDWIGLVIGCLVAALVLCTLAGSWFVMVVGVDRGLSHQDMPCK